MKNEQFVLDNQDTWKQIILLYRYFLNKWIRETVSKETAVLRLWRVSKQVLGLSTELITDGKLATVKRFERSLRWPIQFSFSSQLVRYYLFHYYILLLHVVYSYIVASSCYYTITIEIKFLPFFN